MVGGGGGEGEMVKGRWGRGRMGSGRGREYERGGGERECTRRRKQEINCRENRSGSDEMGGKIIVWKRKGSGDGGKWARKTEVK